MTAPDPRLDEIQAITDFLLARIAEDERTAYNLMGEREGDRTLAESAAKRTIIEVLTAPPTTDPHAAWMSDAGLRALTAVYASHPDYQQEWAA